MKKKTIFKVIASALCSVMFLGCFAACGEDAPVEDGKQQLDVVEGEYLYRNGISGYSILLRDDANMYEELAASELMQNLQKATGSAISVVKDSQLKSDTRIISLGHTSLWDKKVNKTLSKNDIIDSGYYIETVGNNVFISCPDMTTSSGVLYGVYDFLNDAIDYTFYAKDEIKIVETKTIPLYDYSGYIVNPAFEMRQLVNGDLRDDSLTTMRYRMAYPSEAYGFVNWGHGQVGKFIPLNEKCSCGLEGCEGKTFYQHHKDWFSADKKQLCYTGGEVLVEQIAKKFVKYFQAFPDATWFMFGQEDVISHCTCDRCLAAMEEYACNQGGLQVALMNEVIKLTNAWLEENEPGREVKYVVYSYYGTRPAPVKKDANGEIVAYSDKVIPDEDLYIFYTPIEMNFGYQIESGMNADVYTDLYNWSKIAAGQMFIYLYDINFHHYLLNFNNFTTVKGMYEECARLGVSCMLSQAAGTYTACFQEMRSYVESNLMWDLSLSYDDLVRDFMQQYFKDAWEHIYEYYKIIRDRYAYYQNIKNPGSGGIYGDIASVDCWTQPVVQKIDDQFALALKCIEKYKTSDPALYAMLEARIMKENMTPLYLKLTVLKSYYSEQEVTDMKATFKYYVNYFRMNEVQEGHGFGADLIG